MDLLWTALVMGLAGSFHCFAMCGPLVMSMPAPHANLPKLLLNRLLYNSGRIFSYILIGLVFGLLSQAIALVAYQQVVSILAGALLLLWFIATMLSRKPVFGGSLLRKWSNLTSGIFRKLVQRKGFFATLGLGTLNGFLPCGLVYIAAAASMHAGNTVYSMLYMLMFGLGTLPVMLAVMVAGKYIQLSVRQAFQKVVPYVTLFMATLFILRGLALGIPYISPKIQQLENSKIESSCCEKH